MIRSLKNRRTKLIEYEYMEFPSGEPHLIIISDDETTYGVEVVCDILNFEDVGQLFLLNDALKRQMLDKYICELHIPFFPCARQDRVCNNGEPLSVAVFADLINNLDIPTVNIYDPHSDVVSALINNVIVHDITEWIDEVINDCKPDVLIAPDAGATKKVNKVAQKFDLPVVQCGKVRDTKTGELSGFEVYDNQKLVGASKCLIIDDIGDGFGTHIGLSKELYRAGSLETNIYVTHGLFTKGADIVCSTFNKVYTTNTINRDWTDSRIKVVNIL